MISLHIRSMWETTVMHKQVSGWTVNFGPNFHSQSLLRNTPPPFWKTSDLGWPKFTPEYPPPFWKTSDLGWPKFTPEYPPPILENFRFGMTKVYSGIPPQFRKTSDLGWPKNTPPPILENFRFGIKVYSGIPPPQWKLSESPSPRFSEYRELLHVETLSNPDNYWSLDGPPHILLHNTAKRHRSQVWVNGLSHEAMFVESGHVFRLIVLIMELLVKKAKRNNKLLRFTQPMLNMTFPTDRPFK